MGLDFPCIFVFGFFWYGVFTGFFFPPGVFVIVVAGVVAVAGVVVGGVCFGVASWPVRLFVYFYCQLLPRLRFIG